MEKILIPATLDNQLVVRVFTCYPHQIEHGPVEIEGYFTNIVLPNPRTRFKSHEQVVRIICTWQESEKGRNSLVLAYQVLRMTSIRDDRSEWGHKNFSSLHDQQTLTNKVFVYSNTWVKEMLFKDLIKDIHETRFAPHEELVRRHVSSYTPFAYERLLEDENAVDDTKLLKLGSATYVVLKDGIEYKPEPSINKRYSANKAA